MIYAAAVVGVAAVTVPWMWRHVTTHAVTMMHEFGHTVMTVLMGGRPVGVKLHRDSSGSTQWRAPRRQMRVRAAVVAWWGVPTPGVIGAVCMWAVAQNQVRWAMFGLAVMVAVMAALIRNLWGLLVVVVLGWLGWLGWNTGGWVPTAVSVTAAVVATFGGLRSGYEEMQVRRDPSSDASRLQQMLWLPAGFWSATMLTVAAAATGIAVWQFAVAAR